MSHVFTSGTVFDDISLRGCIVQSECQCKHNKIYNSSEVYRQNRMEWYVKYFTMATCFIRSPPCVGFSVLTSIIWVVSVRALRDDGLVRTSKYLQHVQWKRVHM